MEGRQDGPRSKRDLRPTELRSTSWDESVPGLELSLVNKPTDRRSHLRSVALVIPHVAPHLGLWAEPILTAPEELPVVR